MENFGLFFEMGLIDIVASTSAHANVTVLLIQLSDLLTLKPLVYCKAGLDFGLDFKKLKKFKIEKLKKIRKKKERRKKFF